LSDVEKKSGDYWQYWQQQIHPRNTFATK